MADRDDRKRRGKRDPKKGRAPKGDAKPKNEVRPEDEARPKDRRRLTEEDVPKGIKDRREREDREILAREKSGEVVERSVLSGRTLGYSEDPRQRVPEPEVTDEAPVADADLPAADTTPDQPPMNDEALAVEREEEETEPSKGMASFLDRRSRKGTYQAQARASAEPRPKRTKMVPIPSSGIIPERDLHQTPVLECRHLGIDFGGLHAVEDFNLTVGKTEIAGLIGPNGAGKTTVFNLLTKVYQPTRGTILLDGVDTHGMSTPKVAQAGIARTFQNIRLFANLTVEENVAIGLHNQVRCGMWSSIFRLPRFWAAEREFHHKALELLDIFSMADLAEVTAGNLPYGAQRRLEIIRALATAPKLLLLDEPAAGMNPVETEELMTNIRKIRDEFQIAVMLIEHDMDLVMNICEGIAVLNYGKVIAKGTPAEIQGNEQVIEAYLGSGAKGA